MSYSFDITAPTAGEAKAKVVEQMNEVVRTQPAHAKDKEAAITAAHAFIDMLANDTRLDIRVTVHGSVGYEYDATDPNCERPNIPYSQASVGVGAWHVPKKT